MTITWLRGGSYNDIFRLHRVRTCVLDSVRPSVVRALLCPLLTFVCRAVLVARASPRSSTFFKYLWITIRAINIVLSPSMVFPWRDEQQIYAIEERLALGLGWTARVSRLRRRHRRTCHPHKEAN